MIKKTYVQFTALAVRLLTNRFITTYIASSPTLTSSRRLNLCPPPGSTSSSTPATPTNSGHVQQQQQQQQQKEQQQLHLTVRDVGANDENVESHLFWAQCIVVVFVRTDEDSFDRASELLERARMLRPNTPAVLVANKADLLSSNNNSASSEKCVALEDCHELALRHGCLFFEMSVMESPVGARLVLMALLSELLKSGQQQQQQQQPLSGKKLAGSPTKMKMSSRRLWMKVFGALCKSLCTPSSHHVASL